MKINTLWTEKYRPKTIDEYVFTDNVLRTKVKHWIKTQDIPHLLFSGRAGIGKTTMAKLLILNLNIEGCDTLSINASRERGIDVIRDTIKNFCSTMPYGKMKVVLLDEADALTFQAQASLKGTMEEFSTACRFILTTNHPSKIIPPLHSRCDSIHIENLDLTEFTARAATILITEEIDFDLEILDTYVKATYPDLRKCLNSLQQNSTSGTLKSPSISDNTLSDYRLKFVELFKQGNIMEARKLFCTNAALEDIDDVIRWCYDNLALWATSDQEQDEAILIIRNALVNASLCADQEVNLAAMCVELAAITKD